MNEIEEFLAQIDSIVKRINLPSLFQGEPEEDGGELRHQKMLICFPNLSEWERHSIYSSSLLAEAARKSLTLKVMGDGDTNPARLAAAKRNVRRNLKKLIRGIDASGVRARLSDFQEKLLDHLLRTSNKRK